MRFPLAWKGELLGQSIRCHDRIVQTASVVSWDGEEMKVCPLNYRQSRDAWIMQKLTELPGTPLSKLIALEMFGASA